MSIKVETDKTLQQSYQAVLSKLLRDEDNKFCVDCDAKGPGWASWNLGIFLCIRCAGLHRNLGVHISKVKSVNLDSWTADQLLMVQEMGNSRARAVYEANLPDSFRRPLTNQDLDIFIRAKYEHKLYIAKEWVPPQLKVSQQSSVENASKEKTKSSKPGVVEETKKLERHKVTRSDPVKLHVAPVRTSVTLPSVQASSSSPSVDLIAIDSTSTANDSNNIFGPVNPKPSLAVDDEINLLGESPEVQAQRKSAKDEILRLYGTSSGGSYGQPGMNAHQPYNHPMLMGGNRAFTPNNTQHYAMMPNLQQPYAGGQWNAGMVPPRPSYPGPMMGWAPSGGAYPPVNAAALQFNQMQQQMATMTLRGSGPSLGQYPTYMSTVGGGIGCSGVGTASSAAPGQTLSQNLWQ